mmetsp:Transcript_27592/g.49761  ORF Transcript_27592/g.49761 Transcript_27592/m.49761 type:complete len:383 (+) Transcript_27592:496-1644(+)
MKLGLVVDFRKKDSRLIAEFKEELMKLLDFLHLKQAGSVVVCKLLGDGYTEVYTSGKRAPSVEEYLTAISTVRFFNEEPEISPIILKNSARTCIKHLTTSCTCLVVITDFLERWREDRGTGLMFASQVQFYELSPSAPCDLKARSVFPDAIGMRGMFRDILQNFLPEVYGAILAFNTEHQDGTLEIEVSLTPAIQYLEKMKSAKESFELFLEKKVSKDSVDLQQVFGRPWYLTSSSRTFNELYRAAYSDRVSLICSSTWNLDKLEASFLPNYYLLLAGSESLPCFLVKQLIVSEFLRPPPPLQELSYDCRELSHFKMMPVEDFNPVNIESGVHHRLRYKQEPQPVVVLEEAKPSVPVTNQMQTRRSNRQLLSGVVAGLLKKK